MKERKISERSLLAFRNHLIESEKSCATIEKYMRDARRFAAYIGGKAVEKSLVVDYKTDIRSRYAVASANSMLASINAFFRFAGWLDLCVRQFRVQRQVYLPEEKELSKAEYERLVHTAQAQGDKRLSLILQTICSTGIRVSELKHITVEAVQKGEAIVQCKGKTRSVFLVQALRRQLLAYIQAQHIASGPVFVTRGGKSLSRTAVWRGMKQLCARAGVCSSKVFPHNLRHLFARTFYGIEKDLAKLADILGHTSINTTRIYIASSGAEHRRRMEHLQLVLQMKKASGHSAAGLGLT